MPRTAISVSPDARVALNRLSRILSTALDQKITHSDAILIADALIAEGGITRRQVREAFASI